MSLGWLDLKTKNGQLETLYWSALVITGKFAFHLSCLLKFNYLFVSLTGYRMQTAYLWEANTKFNSSTLNLLSSVWLGYKLLLIQMMEFRNLSKCYSKMHSLLLINSMRNNLMSELASKPFTHSEFALKNPPNSKEFSLF